MPSRSGRLSRSFAGLGALGRLLLGHVAALRDRRLQDIATSALRDGARPQAWVVTAVNATLRVRQALTRALYLEPRALVSRLRFTRPEQELAHGRLSLLCPTRERVGQLDTFLRSVHRSAAVPGRVEVLCYVDADDVDVDRYRALFAAAHRRYPRLRRCVVRVGDPVGVPAAWNALAALAEGDLLLMANDDQLYVEYGWDVRLDQSLARVCASHADGVCCLYFDAGRYPDGAADFPIVSRRWYDALGYFTPTIFEQWEVERWVFDVARRVGRLFVVPGVFVEHRHYQDYKAPFDRTYQRHRLTRAKSFADHALFLRTAPERDQAAAALRRAMSAQAGTPAADTPWFCGYLEQHAPKIRAEVDALDAQRHQPAAAGIHLRQDGCWNEAARAALPVTAAVVAGIPEAVTFGRGDVSLVRVSSDAVLAAPERADHVRVHLGVRLPRSMVLEVAGQARTAREGECVIVRDRGGDVRAVIPAGGEPATFLAVDVISPAHRWTDGAR